MVPHIGIYNSIIAIFRTVGHLKIVSWIFTRWRSMVQSSPILIRLSWWTWTHNCLWFINFVNMSNACDIRKCVIWNRTKYCWNISWAIPTLYGPYIPCYEIPNHYYFWQCELQYSKRNINIAYYSYGICLYSIFVAYHRTVIFILGSKKQLNSLSVRVNRRNICHSHFQYIICVII